MKAFVHTKYVPKPTEVLIKVHAASLNSGDAHIMRADPFPVRFMTGLTRPNPRPLGSDISGVVEKIGSDVKGLRVGDEVFGEIPAPAFGAFAEYVCIGEEFVAVKPRNMSFEEAAVVPMAACTAFEGLKVVAKVQAGQRVLINGSSGGVGTFAIQIAKTMGAEVTAVCSTKNLDLVRSLGADHVVDYTKENFTDATNVQYDVIFDTVSTQSFSNCVKVMKPKGIYVWVGGIQKGMGFLWFFAKAKMMSAFKSQTVTNFLQMPKPGTPDLKEIRELIENGKVRAVIDRRYALDQVVAAMEYLEEGHVRGKVVVNIA
ncbi:hypothetical protein HDU67_001150 [Dinochytrium kinnereticum]|nr:hypothetical protein HDU67_001150 [Dinochytrium kinnereticum]